MNSLPSGGRSALLLAFAGACVALAAPAIARPTDDPARRSFPLRPLASAERAIRVAPDVDAVRDLRDHRGPVVLDDVPVPGGDTVSLALTPVRVVDRDTRVAVDGAESRLGDAARDLSLWRGRVVGEEDSFVFLAFSSLGSRGVIRSPGRLVQIVAEADPAAGWEASTSLMTAADPAEAPAKTAACGAAFLDQPMARSPEEIRDHARRLRALDDEAGAPALGGLPTVYECRIAVETDYQFYLLFGDVDAAETYIITLMAAVSALYEQEIGCVITVPYIGLHSSSGDGWSAQDSGGDAQDVLYEFRNAWKSGGAPATADLYHFLSGASLGGGIAYIDVLCSQNYGFGVSGDMGGDLTFPVSKGYGTWDFVVVAHELGHNFATPHTHDYCPPIDRCAPSGYYGPCQSSQVCVSNGTIMSYCHACPGGMSNIDIDFHATVEDTLRAGVETSCLQAWEGTDALCLASEETVDETSVYGGSAPSPRAVTIEDCLATGNLPFTAALSGAPSWVSVSPPSGAITASTLDLTLTFDVSGLGTGTHETTLVVTNTDDPTEVLSVPVTLEVSPTAFRPGDRLTGTLGDGDVDRACFEGLKGAEFRFSITLDESSPKVKLSLFDAKGDKVGKWTASPGATTSKAPDLDDDGEYELRVEPADGAPGDYAVETELDFPSSASPKTKTLKAKSGESYAQLKVRALAGATLDVSCVENSKFTGPVVLTLLDPNGDAVDLAAVLSGDGRSFTGLTLPLTGQYKLRVAGYGGGKKEKVEVTVTPTQPVGVDDVAID